MEPAQAGFQKIVAEILRRAPAEDAVGIAWQLACGKTVAGRTQVLEFMPPAGRAAGKKFDGDPAEITKQVVDLLANEAKIFA